MDRELLSRYARLIVEVGANVQPGQIVWVVAEPSAAPLVEAVAIAAYERGALFVDPWYFDPYVKRARLEHADPATLGVVPPWYGKRLLALGESHGVRISITPQVPPGLLDGFDPAIAGRDALPAHRENFQVINARTTNWTVVPWAAREWAQTVFPALSGDEAVDRLWEKLVYVLRLDEPDPCEAWRVRLQELHDAGCRIDDHRFDALRFEGPGTDLTVGLLPTSRFSSETPGMQTVDGVVHAPNIPTEEVGSAPDPQRVDGVVSATKPLDVEGTLVTDLVIRFENGRAVVDRRRERRCAPLTDGRRRRRVAARRGCARRPRGTNREDRHCLLQHVARRERGEPSRVRQCVCNLRGARGSRTDQRKPDPHRLHDRRRRRHRHRTRRRRVADSRSTRRRLAALTAPRVRRGAAAHPA